MDATVAGEDLPLPIDQDRDIEPERFDAAGDLFDLPVAMEPWIARIKLELLDRDPLDQKLAYSTPLASHAPHPRAPVRWPTESAS